MKYLLVLFIVVNLFGQSAFAQSSVWKVTKGEGYFYIGGTIHVLSEGDYPLPKAFRQAYSDADEIVFETEMDKLNAPEQQAKFMEALTYSDKRTLASELNAKNYQKLENYLTSRTIPIVNFSAFQPWGVSIVITMMEYQRLGMKAELGVDAYFNQLALSDNKKRSGLETVDQQLTAIKSMGDIDPNEVIEYTLRDIDRLPEFIKIMKQSWLHGDLEALSKSVVVMQMKNDTPAMYKAILTDRNNNWMKSLPSFVENESVEFVLVGAMHLAGEEGLLHQLKVQGFKVELL